MVVEIPTAVTTALPVSFLNHTLSPCCLTFNCLL